MNWLDLETALRDRERELWTCSLITPSERLEIRREILVDLAEVVRRLWAKGKDGQ